MKLSAAIMAHPVRRESAERVQASLDRHVPIVYDENPVPSADKMQRWAVGRRAWEAHDPTADWHLVLQDDVQVAQNLLAGLEQALTQLGHDGLVSAYTGTGRPNQKAAQRALGHATRCNHSWLTLQSLHWGPAIIAPVHTIPHMLDWCEPRAHTTNYDKLLGTYYRDILGWRTWYTVPSLVDHQGLPSLVGHDTGPTRTAHRFQIGSALDIDWTRTPAAGLSPNIKQT